MDQGIVKGDTARSRRSSLSYDYWLMSRRRRSSVRSIIDSIMENVGNDTKSGIAPRSGSSTSRPVTATKGLGSQNRSTIVENEREDIVPPPAAFDKRDSGDLVSNPPGTQKERERRCCLRRMSLPCVMSALRKSQVTPGSKLVSRALSSSATAEEGGIARGGLGAHPRKSSWTIVSKVPVDRPRHRQRPAANDRSEQQDIGKINTSSGLDPSLRSIDSSDRFEPPLSSSPKLSTCRKRNGHANSGHESSTDQSEARQDRGGPGVDHRNSVFLPSSSFNPGASPASHILHSQTGPSRSASRYPLDDNLRHTNIEKKTRSNFVPNYEELPRAGDNERKSKYYKSKLYPAKNIHHNDGCITSKNIAGSSKPTTPTVTAKRNRDGVCSTLCSGDTNSSECDLRLDLGTAAKTVTRELDPSRLPANVSNGQGKRVSSSTKPATKTTSVTASSGREKAASGCEKACDKGHFVFEMASALARHRHCDSNRGGRDPTTSERDIPSNEHDQVIAIIGRGAASTTENHVVRSNPGPPFTPPNSSDSDSKPVFKPGTFAWSSVGVAERLRWLQGERGGGGGGSRSTITAPANTARAPATETATTTTAAAVATTTAPAATAPTCSAATNSIQAQPQPVGLISQEARPGDTKAKGVIPDHLRRRIRSEDLTSVKSYWRYKTQPPELTTEDKGDPFQDAEPAPRRKFKYEGRHMTQPITPDEMREAEATTPAPDLARTPGGSIADRLNQLKTSGEEEWKRRVGKKDDLILTPDVVVKLRDKSCDSLARPTSIADRLNQIETAKSTWRGRVEETDVKRFTVAGKLANNAVDSPLVQKLKNLPKTEEPSSNGNSPLASPSTPKKECIAKIPIPKEIIHDPTVTIERDKPKPAPAEGEEEEAQPVQVEVPSIGEEIESFFSVKSIEDIQDTVEVTADDFDNIFIEANDILPTVRKLRPQRKTKARSLNPLKTMSQRLDIKQEYTQIQLGTAEKEFKRMKKENLARDAGFAQAALAGLASKENFKSVELRRSDSASLAHGQRLDPFSELMLLHVKGRRTVQTRLVEPHGRSINSGDCYILVTPEKIIQWEGQFANVIEKAKASEIAGYILQKKDLGCKKCNEVQTVTQARDHLGAGKAFWAALEGDKQSQAAGPDNEDELYENSITRSNMIYRLEGNALLPYEEYWGVTPKHAMLKRNEVLVFDFGPEFYIWQGKGVTMEQRKLGMKLAKQLFDKGYDYSMSAISPFSPLRIEEDGGLPTQATKRPKWTIFGKVNQNMETILFREKFADWPDSSRLIGVKGQDSLENSQKEAPAELKPFDATQMLPLNTAPVSLKLDGAHVGRGVNWTEDMQGFIKTQEIVTLEVTVWHVLEYEHCKLPALSRGQFHDGDTYVVRWQYMITNANLRSLKGSAARNSLTGRERCAYFFWQGNSSTINEKGASALMTVELDEERGPQVRVLQGKEPPCFLNLFGGSMIVHLGKREDPDTNTKGAWRLYCVRGDYENEICLQEIPVNIEHLRSRSSLFLLNVKTGLMYIWHGVKSPSHVRECCRKVVEKLQKDTPLELSLHKGATLTAVEVNEGEEKSEIWSAFDSRDRKSYYSLLKDPSSSHHTLRLFHMSSVNMTFEVHEQLNPSRVHDLPTPFPFLQADLYKSSQPALFMLDNHHTVYLWQGWWPLGSDDHENVHTGSATARFNMDRRCAMETVLHYCRVKNPDSPPPAYLICAGVEPKHFTTLFPFWEVDTVVKEIALEEGKPEDYQEKLEDVLQRITQTRYTLAQLQERPLPEGVDPLRLEAYLDDEEFQDILEMDKEEFYQMPAWKQKVEKQRVGLF